MQNPTNGMEKGDEQVKSTKKIILMIFIVLAVLCLGVALILLISFWCPIVTFINLPQLCSSYQAPNKSFTNSTTDASSAVNVTMLKSIGNVILQVSTNCDYQDKDIAKIAGSNQQLCEKTCAANPKCDGFSFSQLTNICVLKQWTKSNLTTNFKNQFVCGYIIMRGSDVNETTTSTSASNRLNPTTIAAGPTINPILVNYEGFNFELSMLGDATGFKWAEKCDFQGGDIQKMPSYSFYTCGKACTYNLNCDRFSYSVSTQTCFLKKWPFSNLSPEIKNADYYCGYPIDRPSEGDKVWRTV